MKVKLKVRNESGGWTEFQETSMYAGDKYQLLDDLGLFMSMEFGPNDNLETLLSLVYHVGVKLRKMALLVLHRLCIGLRHGPFEDSSR